MTFHVPFASGLAVTFLAVAVPSPAQSTDAKAPAPATSSVTTGRLSRADRLAELKRKLEEEIAAKRDAGPTPLVAEKPARIPEPEEQRLHEELATARDNLERERKTRQEVENAHKAARLEAADLKALLKKAENHLAQERRRAGEAQDRAASDIASVRRASAEKLSALRKELEAAEAEVAARDQRMRKLEQDLVKTRSGENKKRASEQEAFEREISALKQRLREREQELTERDEQLETLERRAADHAEAMRRLSREREDMRARGTEGEPAARKLRDAEEAAERAQGRVAELEKEVARLQQVSRDLAEEKQRRATAEKREKGLVEDVGALKRKLEEARVRAETAAEKAKSRVEALEQEVAELRRTDKDLRRELRAAGKAVTEAGKKAARLEKALEQSVAIGDALEERVETLTRSLADSRGALAELMNASKSRTSKAPPAALDEELYELHGLLEDVKASLGSHLSQP